VFCTLCEEGFGHYFDATSPRCRPCNQKPLATLLGVIFGPLGLIVFCFFGRRYAWRYHPAWWERQRLLARRWYFRFFDALPGIKIVLSVSSQLEWRRTCAPFH
jgi:hypothetical protein